MIRSWLPGSCRRAEASPQLANSIVVNTLDAFAGGCHAKFALVLVDKARHYIYIEDQAMESLEIFEMLLQALRNQAGLRVILLTGAPDPMDPPSRDIGKTLVCWWFYRRLTPEQRGRFHFFEATRYVVHAKIFVIDDLFAIICSAGMFTRSLTQELEHAVAFVASGGDTSIRAFRERLWAELHRVDLAAYRSAHGTLEQALETWNPEVAHGGRPLALPTYATRLAQAEHCFDRDLLLPVSDIDGLVTFEPGQELIREAMDYFELDPNRYLVLEAAGFVARFLDWQPRKWVRLAVYSPDDGQVHLLPRVGFNYDQPLPEPPPEVQPGSITDARLFTAVSAVDFTTQHIQPFPFPKDLSEFGVMVLCTGGSNAGQLRSILSHSSATITFDEFEHPVDTDFSYELRYPSLREVDLPLYGEARSYAGDASGLLMDTTVHLLTHEVPFISLFNPSRIGRMAVPLPVGEAVAINQVVELVFLAPPTSTISWECDEPDATPASASGITFLVQFGTSGEKRVRASIAVPDGESITYQYRIQVLENSGSQWCARFEPSRDVADLVEPFRSKVEAFLAALDEAGVNYRILSTRRPAPRAYLMAWSFAIARNGKASTEVDSRRDDVLISWVHYDAGGAPDLAASRNAAEAMVTGYGIDPNSGAAEKSWHVEGKAIDVTVPVSPAREVRLANGKRLLMNSQARLTRIGRSYGLRRRKTTGHWSVTGG